MIRLVLLRRQPESKPIVTAWVTSKPHVSARRRYVRFGFGRNNYCDCSDCVARPSRVIRLGVQSSWSGVGPVAVPRSSVCVHALSIQDALSFTCRVEEPAQTLHSGRPNALACKADPLCPSPNKSTKKNRKPPGFSFPTVIHPKM